MAVRIIKGDVRDKLPELPTDYFDCIVTSPPYYGLRDYNCEGQIGLEPTLDAWLETMVAICRELRRVLKPSGVCFINIGDSYACTPNGRSAAATKATGKDDRTFRDKPFSTIGGLIKAKDLMLVPERLGIALQADGWWVRSHIIWAKKNPMPESCTDRPTSAHETIWMLTKNAKYYWDAEAVKEEATGTTNAATFRNGGAYTGCRSFNNSSNIPLDSTGTRPNETGLRNLRNVWHMASQPYSGAHFATFPTELAERCIKAGSSERGCCVECGKPWVRIVGKSGGTTGHSWHDHKLDLVQGQRKNEDCMDSSYRVQTLGWQPSCKCEEFHCVNCANVLELDDDKHNGMRSLQEAVSPGQSGEKILQPRMSLSGQEEIAGHQMQGMRNDVQAEGFDNEVLQSTLQLQAYVSEQRNNERLDNNQQGLSDASSSKSSECDALRIHDGTPFSYGKEVKPLLDEQRGCASQKRGPSGQPNRKFGANGKEGTRRPQKANLHGRMSALQESVPNKRTCPHCGSIMERTAPNPVPSKILDCFAGAGTTGLVADRLGRDCTLIDLNTEYAEMALKRIKDDCPMFTEVSANDQI